MIRLAIAISKSPVALNPRSLFTRRDLPLNAEGVNAEGVAEGVKSALDS